MLLKGWKAYVETPLEASWATKKHKKLKIDFAVFELFVLLCG
jgi:hypothetical protein